LFTPEIDSSFCREAKVWSPASVSPQLANSGKEVFDALLRIKNAQLAEAFVESGDFLVLFDNMKTFRSDHVKYRMANGISRKAKTVLNCVFTSGSGVPRFLYSSGVAGLPFLPMQLGMQLIGEGVSEFRLMAA
jgi:hypothetical protein